MATTEPSAPDSSRIYIAELAAMLEPRRAVHTIRQWVAQGLLPDHLQPGREGGRDQLFWTADQVEGIQAFARERDARRGWGHIHRRESGESA